MSDLDRQKLAESIIRPLVDRLIHEGTIPKPKDGYEVEATTLRPNLERMMHDPNNIKCPLFVIPAEVIEWCERCGSSCQCVDGAHSVNWSNCRCPKSEEEKTWRDRPALL